MRCSRQRSLALRNPLDSVMHRTTHSTLPTIRYNTFIPFHAKLQSYFDVDTTTVLQRVALSMIPREGFIAETCNGQIDLYGMFPHEPLDLRPLLDPYHAHPRSLHHVDAHCEHHSISRVSPIYQQSPSSLDCGHDRLRLRAFISGTFMGGDHLAGSRRLACRRGSGYLRLCHERLHSDQPTVLDPGGPTSLGIGHHRRSEFGLFHVSISQNYLM